MASGGAAAGLELARPRFNLWRNVAKGWTERSLNQRRPMRRLTNRLLLLLALALLALGAAGQLGLIPAPAPPLAFGAGAAILALLLVIRILPLAIRRPVVFLVALAVLAAATG